MNITWVIKMLQLPSLYLYLSSHVSCHLEEPALQGEGRVTHSCNVSNRDGLCFSLPSRWGRLKIHGEWCWNLPLLEISGWSGRGNNSWLQFLAAACLSLPPPWSCLPGGLKFLFPLLFPPLFSSVLLASDALSASTWQKYQRLIL